MSDQHSDFNPPYQSQPPQGPYFQGPQGEPQLQNYGQPAPAAPQQPYGQPNPYQPQVNPAVHTHAAPPASQHSYTHPAQQPQAPQFTPYGSQPPYAAQNQHSAFGPKADRPKMSAARKKSVTLVGAVALVAALVGGGIGGGIVAAGDHGSVTTSSSTASSGGAVTSTNEGTTADLSSVVTSGLKKVVTISAVDSSGQEAGTGSGIVINKDSGYIVTNAHVVTLDGETGSASITVQTSTGDVYKASVLGYDATADVAVIKVSGTMDGVENATFASSSNVKVGTGTIAIGSPLGLSGTVTTGIVSALNRPITVASSAVSSSSSLNGGESTQTASGIALNVLQTDASINPGNSGGALLDDNGNVIGMNAAIASTSSSSSSTSQSGSVGVGFAIPSDYVKRIANEIIAGGKGTHGFLGVGLADATESNSLFTSGAKLSSVTSGGAASAAGLKSGDVVTGFNDTKITSALQLASLVKQEAPGSSVKLSYTRGGSDGTATVTLASDAS